MGFNLKVLTLVTGLGTALAASAADLEWQFTYAGDIEGEVAGEVLSSTAVMTNLTIAGGAYGEQPGKRATQKFRMTVSRSPDGAPASVLFNLTLPDGTKCNNTGAVEADIQDDNKKTLEATFAGEMDCDGQRADFEGWVNADP
ncbi:hypothetical protein F3N42_00380 [Marinihelvus fidelis]|uniref:Uncharacterized protein n=1 Tax=Marinihelvus fidelis TaxID=2613842 RepID=A0A5N0TG70_9GAMM|nr:hypothetical protein [Marinihelvus fidelis]KAA9134042.1 hypothetical protein F3N42_00380 [Marinihelvus fidelis]